MFPPKTEDDLRAMIAAGVEESLELEYKRCESLDRTDGRPTEISKDVSAFANSVGGHLIYGLEEDKATRTAKAISPVDSGKFPKEWLEQVINSRIQPRIAGLRIEPVTLTTFGAGMVAYVVEIPEGQTAHQASDHRYYKRYNFQSIAMEDYEVRQTMNRAVKPAYQCWLMPVRNETGGPTQYRIHFRVRVLNVSELQAHDCSSNVYIDADFFSCRGEDWEMTQIDGRDYRRLQVSPATSITDMPPGSSRLITYSPGIDYNPYDLVEKTRVFVKLFDTFGLALFQEFELDMRTGIVSAGPIRYEDRKPSVVQP